MSASPRIVPASGPEGALLGRVRAAVIGVPALVVACGAVGLRADLRLALASVAVALGWTRLTDP